MIDAANAANAAGLHHLQDNCLLQGHHRAGGSISTAPWQQEGTVCYAKVLDSLGLLGCKGWLANVLSHGLGTPKSNRHWTQTSQFDPQNPKGCWVKPHFPALSCRNVRWKIFITSPHFEPKFTAWQCNHKRASTDSLRLTRWHFSKSRCQKLPKVQARHAIRQMFCKDYETLTKQPTHIPTPGRKLRTWACPRDKAAS